jgi:hypothetical protein
LVSGFFSVFLCLRLTGPTNFFCSFPPPLHPPPPPPPAPAAAGKGVSSSAAVEVAVMSALASAHALDLPGRDLALLCQKVENLVGSCPAPAGGGSCC